VRLGSAARACACAGPRACARRVRGQHLEPLGPVLCHVAGAGRVLNVERHPGALQGELPAVLSVGPGPRSGGQLWLHRPAGAAVVWVNLRRVGAEGGLRRVADAAEGLPWELRGGQQGRLFAHVRGLAEEGGLPQFERVEEGLPPPLRAMPLEPAKEDESG
jgi:hypothetical protein